MDRIDVKVREVDKIETPDLMLSKEQLTKLFDVKGRKDIDTMRNLL